MIRNKVLVAGILGLVIGLGSVATNTVTAKATIKDSLEIYKKDNRAIEHINTWLNSSIANPKDSHYNAKAIKHMKLIKSYLESTSESEKLMLMDKINSVEKKQNDENEFYKFFKDNRHLTMSLQNKCKEFGKFGDKEKAREYITKKMDLMKELFEQRGNYKSVKLIGDDLNAHWEFVK